MSGGASGRVVIAFTAAQLAALAAAEAPDGWVPDPRQDRTAARLVAAGLLVSRPGGYKVTIAGRTALDLARLMGRATAPASAPAPATGAEGAGGAFRRLMGRLVRPQGQAG